MPPCGNGDAPTAGELADADEDDPPDDAAAAAVRLERKWAAAVAA